MACFINNDTASQNAFGIQAKRADTFTGVSFFLFTDGNNIVVKKTATPEDENLTPLDLTDYNIKMEVKLRALDQFATLTFETGTATMIIVNNEIQLFQTAEAMTIPAVNYIYDIQSTDINTQEIKTLIEGIFIVTQDVTN